MNILDLILKLKAIKEEHGNLEVYTAMEYFDVPADEVEVEEAESKKWASGEVLEKPKRVVIC